MFCACGWFKVQPSLSGYASLKSDDFGEMDAQDELINLEATKLEKAMAVWLEQQDDLRWWTAGIYNNERGYFHVFSSKNHRTSSIWDLMSFVAESSIGSYGLVYVHDDEDVIGNKLYGRGCHDFSEEFRVWRVFEGEVSEHADEFFSPFSSKHAFEV